MEDENFVDTFLLPREEHYQRFFGSITQDIMHSTDAKQVHVDIYQFEPTQDRPFWTLITSGMSNQRQPELEDSDNLLRTEIVLYAARPQDWMFSVMKGLAEMPFDDNTNLHWGHTVPNGQPMTAQSSHLTSFFFVPPFFEPLEFNELKLDGDKVNFLWMIPITEAERTYAIEHGSDKLYKKFEDGDVSIVVNEKRESLL